MSILKVEKYISRKIPIISTILSDHLELNNYLKDVIKEHREQNPKSNDSNVKSWHSSYYTHTENLKFKPIVDKMLTMCTFISQSMYHNNSDYMVTEFWAAMYERGEYTISHAHEPSNFACTYYVDVEDGCSPIVFDVDEFDETGECEKFSITPKNGMLLMWPGTLVHQVPPTNSKRILVAANLMAFYRVGDPPYEDSTPQRFPLYPSL
tara:strand:- start:398 stop:1021 length:624 start_codon:yes stop_codon:yes gene_type:complete